MGALGSPRIGKPFAKSAEGNKLDENNSWSLGFGLIRSSDSSLIALNAKNEIIIETEAITAPITKDGPWINTEFFIDTHLGFCERNYFFNTWKSHIEKFW